MGGDDRRRRAASLATIVVGRRRGTRIEGAAAGKGPQELANGPAFRHVLLQDIYGQVVEYTDGHVHVKTMNIRRVNDGELSTRRNEEHTLGEAG